MTDEELLAEAKIKYPIGTRYYQVKGFNPGWEKVQDAFCFRRRGDEAFITDGCGGAVWYSDLGWSKKEKKMFTL